MSRFPDKAELAAFVDAHMQRSQYFVLGAEGLSTAPAMDRRLEALLAGDFTRLLAEELVDTFVADFAKEAEVGDRYEAAKVVMTTTFGAFVELVKGTDGLLHISNVKPGERVDSVDDVLSSGDEIDVTVVEVDRERGRIGLRLSDDPSVEGKSPEELASVGSGDGGRRGGGGGGDRGGRGGRDRGPRRDRERRN